MRATLRITWLLLLLNTQFSSIYSSDSTTNNTVPSNETSVASTAVTAGTKITSTGNETGSSTVAPAAVTEKTQPSQKPTERTNADANSTVTSPTIPVANNPPVSFTTAPTTITLSTTIKATTTASKPPPVSNASATVQTHSAPATSQIPKVTTNQAGRNEVKTTITPEPSRSTEPTSRSLIYTSPVTSPGESSKGVTVTVPTTAHGSTASQDTRLPVIPVITTPSRAVGETTTDQPPIDPHKIPNDDKELSDAEAGTTRPPATTAIIINTPAQQNYFTYSLNNGEESQKDKHLVELCKRLMPNWQIGNCTLTYRKQNDKIQFDTVMINVKTNLAAQYFEEITKEPTDNKTLIAILASCGALLFMIIILAVCASHHRKPYNENQQHLTEELNTVENGYHDNPTLEVMEVQPEMQEKKMALNGEFNDSWIVPIDNLMKDDIPVEEDTHL